MNKQEFLERLQVALSDLPREEAQERLNFYAEMIDDRMEEGLSEEDAVSEIGSADKIISQTISDTSITKITKERIKPKKRLKAWEIVLLALGSPIWFSLAVAAFAVILSLYVVLWSAVISLWSVFGSLVGCAFGGIAAGIALAFGCHALSGTAVIAVGLVCAGLAVFAFFGCKAATKGILLLTKKFGLLIKKLFIKKEVAQ